MEVLSVGEKIKRARIYKGYTLKAVCGNKISVSKLSCIENDKIEPENWVLEYVSLKLNLDINSLKQNIEEQINCNINEILKDKDKEQYEKKVIYNMEMAEKHGYYKLAFYIIHILFKYYINENSLTKVQEFLGKYYDLCNNYGEKLERCIYYMDIAKFFYKNKEFSQANNYFKNVTKNLINKKNKDYNMITESIYGEIMCNIMLENYKEAFVIAQGLNQFSEFVSEDFEKAKLYHIKSLLSLVSNDGKFYEHEEKIYNIYKNNNKCKAKVMFDYAVIMFNIDTIKEKASYYVKTSIELYPKEDKDKLVKFMLSCIELLINNDSLEETSNLIKDVLDYSISLDNIKYIQKSYYLKAKLLIKQNNLTSAEMYMNLALDVLTKFGTKKEIHDKYMEMGEMYYKIGLTKESLKYFILAISLQKKL